MGDNTANDTELEKLAHDIAMHAWTNAANAYRMYPDNKHNFTDYWANIGKDLAIVGYRAKEASLQSKEVAPIWYTKKELYNWLRHENYETDIAAELAERWAISSQMAFQKGWEKAYNDKKAGTLDYVYYPEKEEAELSGQQGKEGGVAKLFKWLDEQRNHYKSLGESDDNITRYWAGRVDSINAIKIYLESNIEWLKPIIIEQGNSEEIERLKLIIKELQSEYMAVQVEPGFRKDDLIDSLQKENELLKEEIKKYQS